MQENVNEQVNWRDWSQPANLLSISRVLFAPIIVYLLSRPGDADAWICLVLLIVAAITDGLDGIVARKLNQTGALGRVLDPLADKVLIAIVIIGLMVFREFPIWLAIVIVGRDLLIVVAASMLLSGKEIIVPSNYTGKYAFVAISTLVASHVIRFPFGISIMTYLSLTFIALSVVFYTRIYLRAARGLNTREFRDSRVFKYSRLGITWLFTVYFLYRMYDYYLVVH